MSVRLSSLDRRPFHPAGWSGPWGSAHLPNAARERPRGRAEAGARGRRVRTCGRSALLGVRCRLPLVLTDPDPGNGDLPSRRETRTCRETP